VLNERLELALGRAFRHTSLPPLPTTKRQGTPERSPETAYYTAARPPYRAGRVKKP